MAITRTRLAFEKHFVQIPNQWMRDKRISRRARGLLAEIMTHDVGWSLTIESLAENGPEGRDSVRTAVIELEKHGYLERTRIKDKQGKYGGTDYKLHDPWADNEPMTENPSLEIQHGEQPMTENPTVVYPTVDKAPLRTPSLKAFKEDHEIEEGGETKLGTSPADFGKESPWNDLQGGSLGAAAPASPGALLHPDRCQFHQAAEFPPPCGACKAARTAEQARIREEHHRAVLADRAARQAAVVARRAAAAGCEICDDEGYAGAALCDHDPGRPDRVRRGVELLRNSLAKK